MSWTLFALILLIHLAAAISPGPSFVMSLRIAASQGLRAACGLAVGFGLGAALWALAALAGLALIFKLVPALFIALKLVGAAFLIWIAWQMWRHAPTPLASHSNPDTRMGFARALRLGFATFATNPKPAVFFGAVFVGMVPQGTSLPWQAAILAGIFINETLWYMLVARVFSGARARTTYMRLKTGINRAFGALIAAFGLKIALS